MPSLTMIVLSLLAQVSSPTPPAAKPLALPSLHYRDTATVCPIGGEIVHTRTLATYSIYGRRPDGRPLSDVAFPVPMPVCSNGLVVLPGLTAAEIEQLRPLIASDAYRRLARDGSPFYRAYWLSIKLHRPVADAIELLQPAIWEAKDRDRTGAGRSRTVRYQRALIDATERFGSELSLDDRAFFQFASANALREMGRFGDAERMRQRAVAIIPRLTRQPLIRMTTDLGPVIARRDAGDEPLDMVPLEEARAQCRIRVSLSSFDRTFCAAQARGS